MRRFLRLFATAFLLAAATAPAHAAQLGVTPDLTWGIAPAAQSAQAATLQAVGVKWVRLNVEWAKAEPRRGHYSGAQLRYVDHAINAARARGIHVLMLISTSPRWASGSWNKQAPPRNPASLRRFARHVAARWAGRVDAYEIWNEENITRFWPTRKGPSARAYTRLLRAAHRGVKAGDKHALVVFGGTSNNDYSFLSHAYAAGAKGAFDVMATHPYTCSSPGHVVWAGKRMHKSSFLAYREVRRTMVRHGDRRKPIWFTEFGWSTHSGYCGVSQAQQSAYLARAMQLVQRNSYVKVALWYGWRNLYWEHDANSLESQFGLVNANGAPKASLYTFRMLAFEGPTKAVVARATAALQK